MYCFNLKASKVKGRDLGNYVPHIDTPTLTHFKGNYLTKCETCVNLLTSVTKKKIQQRGKKTKNKVFSIP